MPFVMPCVDLLMLRERRRAADAGAVKQHARQLIRRIARTAAVFTIGRLRGMRTASILNNVVVCGEDTADAIGGYVDGESLTAAGERNEIRTALEALYRLDREGQA